MSFPLNRGVLGSFLVLVVGVLTVSSTLVLAGTPLSGVISTSQDVWVSGTVDVDSASGALRWRPASTAFDVQLSADRVTVEYFWRNVTHVSSPDGSPVTKFVTNSGGGTYELVDLHAIFAGFGPRPELLATVGGTQHAAFEADAFGPVQARPVQDVLLARAGDSEGTTASNGYQEHSYSFTVDGPWVSLSDLDSGVVRGDYDLFINNISVAGTSQDGEWTTWSGRQYDEQPSPVPGPGVARNYQSRITVLHVEGGALSIASPNSVDLFSEDQHANVSGVVMVEAASGKILLDGVIHQLDAEPIELWGSGTIRLRGAQDAGHETGRDDGGASRLVLQPDVSFAVDSAPGLGVAYASVPTSRSPLVPSWIGTGLAGLGVVGLVFAPPVRAWRDRGAASLRQRRLRKWLARGRTMVDQDCHDRAVPWFRKVATWFSHRPEGWYYLGMSRYDLGDFHKAWSAFERADASLGGRDPEMLVWMARAAHRAGLEEKVVAALGELAEVNPLEFHRFIFEPGHASLLDDGRIQDIVRRPRGDVAADVGYA